MALPRKWFPQAKGRAEKVRNRRGFAFVNPLSLRSIFDQFRLTTPLMIVGCRQPASRGNDYVPAAFNEGNDPGWAQETACTYEIGSSMPGKNTHDLMALLAVARERSFTREATQLDVSQSALTHAIRGLKERLGLRLFPHHAPRGTDGGRRALLRNVGSKFERIDSELSALTGCEKSRQRLFHRLHTPLQPLGFNLYPRYGMREKTTRS